MILALQHPPEERRNQCRAARTSSLTRKVKFRSWDGEEKNCSVNLKWWKNMNCEQVWRETGDEGAKHGLKLFLETSFVFTFLFSTPRKKKKNISLSISTFCFPFLQNIGALAGLFLTCCCMKSHFWWLGSLVSKQIPSFSSLALLLRRFHVSLNLMILTVSDNWKNIHTPEETLLSFWPENSFQILLYICVSLSFPILLTIYWPLRFFRWPFGMSRLPGWESVVWNINVCSNIMISLHLNKGALKNNEQEQPHAKSTLSM